jgi:hypothetical protein
MIFEERVTTTEPMNSSVITIAASSADLFSSIVATFRITFDKISLLMASASL